MSRKDTLKAILSRREQELPHGNSPDSADTSDEEQATEKKLHHIRSGAVGAMGRSLGNIAGAADQARALIASGAAVVELDPSQLEASFVADRLPYEGEDYQRLVEAIKETGQKSPVLVRPHPAKADRYQIAFGHRRVRVLTSLGWKVKAVVQNLTDEELVIIQGQENSARSDLSYIERAQFALALEQRGFDRRVIMTSLSMEKTQLSRLLALGHSLPRSIVEAIGPAPKAGRPRWAALAQRLSQAKDKSLNALLESREFKAADSDTRFNQVMAALSAKRANGKAQTIKSEEGVKLASVERKGSKITLLFDEKASPEFADFVMKQLRELHREYITSRKP
ncbi:plasmid partitioning protein RepB [Neorhizobium alkalisoli]|uniref:plasmid partitioning protein RepB n=1 Tax=Neorhizobium alkalisoli TaxID=528178 RepID=UPI000CF94464|nr:plasmid partitioning protein RepB [Neorhizobium alkalisoli]